jgi:glyoxylate reductase
MKKNETKIFSTLAIPDELAADLRTLGNLESWTQDVPMPNEQLTIELKDCQALLCSGSNRITAEMMSACPKLKVVANVSVGYDNIDVDAATKAGILVTNTPGVLDNATADMAFGLLLAVARRLVEADQYVRSGQWQGFHPSLMLGHEVTGKVLGIVGMGRIGEAMARRARGFGMEVIYTRRGGQEKDERLNEQYSARRVSLGELLKNSDFISLHCPLSPTTKHLIGRVEFSQMKNSAILINTSRGGVINEAELVAALAEKMIAGAGLDVFEFEPEVNAQLLTFTNVVLAPHIASATSDTRLAMKRLAVKNLIAALEGGNPPNAINQKSETTVTIPVPSTK